MDESAKATPMVAPEAVERARVDLETADGTLPCHLFFPVPPDQGPRPSVLYYMDGMGIRPTLLDAAARLAAYGYVVAVPDLFYRGGDYPPFDHATMQDDPKQQARAMELVKLVTNDAAARDTQAILAHLDDEPRASTRAVGCVGYCLGGRLALTAAGRFPERIRVAASIHGAGLATDRPDSPHRLLDRMQAALYVAVAEHDPYIVPGETEVLEQALRESDLDYTFEHYAGCHHGFALPAAHGYDAEADERHRQRVLALFAEHLA